MDTENLFLTLQLAACSALITAVIGLPIAWWLATTRSIWVQCVDVIIPLPMVLPPTVVGFFLLKAFAPLGLAFSYYGLLVGLVISGLPFAIMPFRVAIEGVDRRQVEAAYCLGVSRILTFFKVVLPLARNGILIGIIMVFIHSVGEFGIVLMIGGNISGKTRTISIEIYDNVIGLRERQAMVASLILIALSITVLAVVNYLKRQRAI